MALALKVSKVETIAGNFFVEPHTITLAESNAKEIQLLITPSKPLEVMVDVVGGSPQRSGVDFVVTGDILSWNGYGMETIIGTDDNIRVTYIL